MERYQAILAYDGTSFWGFQAQPGFRTVEGELRSALGSLGWSGRTVLAGGRTDAGVHAEGQVAAFDLEWTHGPEELHRALNAILPKDISCRELQAAAPDFHPRYQALRRCYRYRIFSAAERDPLRERYALRVWPAPNFERMAEAAGRLPGKRDFRAFGSAPRQGSHTVRTVFRAEWQRQGDDYGFLDRSRRVPVPHGADDRRNAAGSGRRTQKPGGVPGAAANATARKIRAAGTGLRFVSDADRLSRRRPVTFG